MISRRRPLWTDDEQPRPFRESLRDAGLLILGGWLLAQLLR